MVFRVLDRNPLQECEGWIKKETNKERKRYKQSTSEIPTFFDQNLIPRRYFGKSLTSVCETETNQGPNIRSLFLSRVWV